VLQRDADGIALRRWQRAGFAAEETETVAEANGFSNVVYKPIDFTQIVSIVTPSPCAI